MFLEASNKNLLEFGSDIGIGSLEVQKCFQLPVHITAVYDRDLCSYELNTGDKMQDIINVIKLISYLKQVVCEDGYKIKKLLIENKTNSNYSGNCYSTANILPKLPKTAERSIQINSAYTPKKSNLI